MTGTGIVELVRRATSLILLAAGLAALGGPNRVLPWVLLACAAGIYLALPRPRPPAGALTYEKGPAVYGPDMVGLFMTSVFLALPFWVMRGEESMWSETVVPVHPSALLTWPLAAITSVILVFAARYANFWVTVETDGLRLHGLRCDRSVSYAQITRVTPYRRGLPRFLLWLAPLLALAGRPTAAGAILLARDTTGFALHLEDGSVLPIDADGFPAAGKVIRALQQNGVAVEIDG